MWRIETVFRTSLDGLAHARQCINKSTYEQAQENISMDAGGKLFGNVHSSTVPNSPQTRLNLNIP